MEFHNSWNNIIIFRLHKWYFDVDGKECNTKLIGVVFCLLAILFFFWILIDTLANIN